ncbi:hypothetical protein CTI14_11160 [Methylobacterium radiotolerans]|nr:hypothetical protein CTI14_11160 [Methylobacterium radiotolerans]
MTSPRRVPADLRKRGGFRGADESTASLILSQFFVGGFFLFIVAFFLALGAADEYDGVTSFIAASIIAVVLSVVSIVTALVIGLPLRLVSALRARWLAHGEITSSGSSSDSAPASCRSCWRAEAGERHSRGGRSSSRGRSSPSRSRISSGQDASAGGSPRAAQQRPGRVSTRGEDQQPEDPGARDADEHVPTHTRRGFLIATGAGVAVTGVGIWLSANSGGRGGRHRTQPGQSPEDCQSTSRSTTARSPVSRYRSASRTAPIRRCALTGASREAIAEP